MLVHPSVPAKTVAEFIAYAKSDPSKINMGSGGKGATGHVAGELFQMMTGLKFQHVPYRGEAAAMTDLIGGQVQLVFATTGSSLQYVKAGQMRALAVTTTTRAVRPAGRAAARGFLARLRGQFVERLRRAAQYAERNHRQAEQGTERRRRRSRPCRRASPARRAAVRRLAPDFGRIIAADVEKWGKVIKASGLTGD